MSMFLNINYTALNWVECISKTFPVQMPLPLYVDMDIASYIVSGTIHTVVATQVVISNLNYLK